MRGLILSGPLGAGKTTLQRRLVADHGFWTPLTVTTRQIEPLESDIVSVTSEAFRAGVLTGGFVLPVRFGANWYGWRSADLLRIKATEVEPPVVINVRPYTALLFAAMVPGLIPVWIWEDAEVLTRRREDRRAIRDTDPTVKDARLTEDEEDSQYEGFFRHRVRSDEFAVAALLALLG